jgi:DNA polymerase I-like protein with 3'-5' exonuclease and polymerase domains
MAGFTNTLRLRHAKPIVNLPGVSGAIPKAILDIGMDSDLKSVLQESVDAIRDGALIRECIVAPKGYELCGSDITSLEDNTKRHFMYDYDPEYVEEQMAEGFDPHLDLAVRAGALTEEQAQAHKDKTEDYKAIRHLYKTANYSCIYGVGAPKLGDTLGIPVREAKKLIEAYWNRNWSVKMLSRDTITKTSGESLWLWNPVNGFYYSVRSEKDIFSTLNQGTGAFVFDLWLKFMRSKDIIPILQYHDEMLAVVKLGRRKEVKKILEESMERVNEMLKLNVKITVDVQFGDSYASVH